MEATYTIPARNLGHLQEQIDALNKRARRLGVAEITLKATHSHHQHAYRGLGSTKGWVNDPDNIPADAQLTGELREWLRIDLAGETPQYAGWRLIGVLEPLQTEDGAQNLVQAVPGCTIPAEYRSRVGQCDHCHTQRRRNETFVVQHEDGSTRMVGRQCLKDFLGHADPHKLASWAELLASLDGTCQDAQDENWMGGGSREPDSWNLERFLLITAAVIRHDGWLSRTKARELNEQYGY